MISPIERLSPLSPTEQEAAQVQSAAGPDLFRSVFQSAIDDVRETDAEKVEAEYLMATGQLDNTAALNLAIYKSQISVEMLVQLRNKALDAYSEITRISL